MKVKLQASWNEVIARKYGWTNRHACVWMELAVGRYVLGFFTASQMKNSADMLAKVNEKCRVNGGGGPYDEIEWMEPFGEPPQKKVKTDDQLQEQLRYIGVRDGHTLEECLGLLNIAGLARVAQVCWKPMYFGAVPYNQAMRQMDTVNDNYGYDSGQSIVLYFLSNASTWRGPIAKAVKAELNKRLKAKG